MRTFGSALRLDAPAIYVAALVAMIGVFHINNILTDDLIRRLSTFSDDFYYYIEIARNLLQTGSLTFDTITHTNGVQPLWFAFVCAVGTVVGFQPDGFLLVFPLITYALVVVCFFGMAACLSRVVRDTRVIAISAFAYAVVAFEIAVGFMEIAATLAILPFLLTRLVQNRILTIEFGFLCAAIFLSRLDSAVFVAALIGGVQLSEPASRAQLAHGLGRAWRPLVGLAPGIAYLAANVVFFGHPIPDSGQAKALTGAITLHEATWWDFIAPKPPSKLVWTLALGYGVLLTALSVLVHLDDARTVRLLRCTVAAVLAFFLVHSLRSSWGLWGWYFYPIVVLIPLEVAVTLQNLHKIKLRAAGVLAVATAAIFLGLTGGKVYRIFQDRYTPIAEAAVDLAGFADRHPGRYAMGDRAGLPAYLMDSPVVQFEGLVTGKRMLDDIANEVPICEALRAYAIDYYVGMRGTMRRTPDGCFRVEEPAQGGPGTPRMRGVLCGDPVDYTNSGFTTTVFDLSTTTCRPPETAAGR